MSAPTPPEASSPEAVLATFDLEHFIEFADLAVTALAQHRAEIDDLNVFPVPDGDTGTNMYLTVEAARDAMRDALKESPGDLRVGLERLCPRRTPGSQGQQRGDPEPADWSALPAHWSGPTRRPLRRRSLLMACKKPQMQPLRQWARLSKAPS
ncbi:MAG: hypothetical protein V9G13_00795 [Marmoricola sp.]